MFKTYLSKTSVTDVTISEDNKYLAIAEIDTSGTLIQSNVKVISIEKAIADNANSSIESTFKSETGKLITDLKYQDKNKLVVMYTDEIHSINEGKEEVLLKQADKKVTFSSIELENYCVQIEEQSSGLFTVDTIVNIKDVSNNKEVNYTIKGAIKEIITKGNVIAINLGADVEFINTQGMLIKRYKSNQEVTNITVSESIAGIVYRDKIELINL